MFFKNLTSTLGIILSFTFMFPKLYSQESDNFLLLYENYDKLNKIEEIIEKSETKILTKYGVDKEFIFDNNLILDPSKHFIGYQIKIFNDKRLIELKFNKSSIENFFKENLVPYLAFEGKVKVFIGVNDSFFQNSNLFILEDNVFQEELVSAKLLSELNQNIDLDFEILDSFPSSKYEEDEMLSMFSEDEKSNWILMLINRFDLNNWSISFPKNSKIFIKNNFEFQNILLEEAVHEISQTYIITEKNTFTASFNSNISEDKFEEIIELLAQSTDILNFNIITIDNSFITIEFETYLNKEKAYNLMVDSGAVSYK
tara:strand:+ start:257 stop:1198 length:942 start_codon:yes stop_codon:yes gene_type:complete